MLYNGAITLDYTGSKKHNERSQLMNALTQAGWKYAETSAVHLESGDLNAALLALEVLARAIGDVGTLSALTVSIQGIAGDLEPPNTKGNPNALKKVLKKDLPQSDVRG
jgi:hypothetical protein